MTLARPLSTVKVRNQANLASCDPDAGGDSSMAKVMPWTRAAITMNGRFLPNLPPLYLTRGEGCERGVTCVQQAQCRGTALAVHADGAHAPINDPPDDGVEHHVDASVDRQHECDPTETQLNVVGVERAAREERESRSSVREAQARLGTTTGSKRRAWQRTRASSRETGP